MRYAGILLGASALVTAVRHAAPVAADEPAITAAPTKTLGERQATGCTPVDWINTNAFTTDPACTNTATGDIEPYEVGTYCGFINPQDPCAPQPGGYGPQASPDTPEEFQDSQQFSDMAVYAPTPMGYYQTFQNKQASVEAPYFLDQHTLHSYDVNMCGSYCTNMSLCTGFNIYLERLPAINPEGCSCTDVPSITSIQCALWGSGVEPDAATNRGQLRGRFRVLIAASNGYESLGKCVCS